MKHNKFLDIAGTIMLAAGMIVAFSSHAFHAKIGLGEEASHLSHIVYGIAAAVAGLGILIYNNNALKNPFKKR